MKRKTVTQVTTVLLLIAIIICIITGFIKWPGLITALGLTYRQVPVALITNIHDWSGLCIVVLTLLHIYQFRGIMKRMTLGIMQYKSQS